MRVHSATFTVMLLTASLMFAGAASAQKTKSKTPQCGKVKITDAAGKVHTVMKMRCITLAQRKAAAQRAIATRARGR